MTIPIELELRKLGLTEKEVKVYLASLELGPTSVQIISQKIGITRPTVYQIIKTLESKGLFLEERKDKKKYFMAQSPDHILGVLRIQKRELEEKEREFIRIIATLKSEYFLEKGVKSYKDIKAMEQDFFLTCSEEIYVINPNKAIQENYKNIKARLGTIKTKELYTRPVKSKIYLPSNLKETLVVSEKAMLISKNEGIIIENKAISNLLKSLFLIIWDLCPLAP